MENQELNIFQGLGYNEIEKLKLLSSIIMDLPSKEVITLRFAITEYLSFINNNRSKAYLKSIRVTFNHLTDFFGLQRSMRSISLKECEDFLSYLQKKAQKGFYVYYRNLKAASNKWLDWGYLNQNYFIKIKLPKKQKLHPAYIDEVAVRRIRDFISVDVIKEVILFAFYTGMRLNEIVNLTWKSIDLTARIIIVGNEDFVTKGKNQRYIPICNELNTLLVYKLNNQSELGVKKYVFRKNDGSPFSGDYFSKRFKGACRKAGIDNSIHFHSLRHSFASYLVQKGVTLYQIKQLLGHSSISTTEIYSHLNLDSLKDAINTFNTNILKKTIPNESNCGGIE